MKTNDIPRIFLVMIFSLTLFSGNYAYGMFNAQGQWVCSKEIDIEITYYNTYAAQFQVAIDEVFLTDGTKAAQSYFESAVKEETVGQDWKRSQDCLVSLGIDVAELPLIRLPEEQIRQDQINFTLKPLEEDDIEDPVTIKEIPLIEEAPAEPADGSPYVAIVVVIIIAIVVFGIYFSKFCKKDPDSKLNLKDYKDKENETKDEHYENVEIEVNGGIEK
ncbi:MAG: hypothetical protein ACR2LL_05365 [Nitrosopumilus sp.]